MDARIDHCCVTCGAFCAYELPGQSPRCEPDIIVVPFIDRGTLFLLYFCSSKCRDEHPIAAKLAKSGS